MPRLPGGSTSSIPGKRRKQRFQSLVRNRRHWLQTASHLRKAFDDLDSYATRPGTEGSTSVPADALLHMLRRPPILSARSYMPANPQCPRRSREIQPHPLEPAHREFAKMLPASPGELRLTIAAPESHFDPQRGLDPPGQAPFPCCREAVLRG